MVYGFNMEELLLHYLYDQDKLAKMLAEHDVHKPLMHGAVMYFHGKTSYRFGISRAYGWERKNGGKTLDLL